MKIPISKRLLCCAQFVAPGARVADIGTDHGYLGIYLLESGIAAHVHACDLRPMPLQKARENAARFGAAERMTFLLSDGMAALSPDAADTIVMAGMGGDLMVRILDAAPWVCSARYTLILQPQSAGQALRLWLAENGFQTQRETLVKDGGYLYTVLLARWNGERRTLCPGAQFVSLQLLSDAGPLLPEYFSRIESALRATVDGLRGAEHPRPERLAYHETALREITEMRKAYAERT